MDTLVTLAATLFLIQTMILIAGFLGIAALVLLLSKNVVLIPELLQRIINLENSFINTTSDTEEDYSTHTLWQSADGRYKANSFEELLSKMLDDPNSPFSPEEIEAIKSALNKIMGNKNDEEDDNGWNK